MMLKLSVLLSIIILVVFAPCLNAHFINLDDPELLLNNPLLKHVTFNTFGQVFYHLNSLIYIPLTIFSFALEKTFFGLNPFIYHLDNVLLHIAVVILVFYLACRMGLGVIAAFIAAMIFGIHPMKVESVAWVTERKDVLYSFFYLLALHQYMSYQDSKSKIAYVLTIVFGLSSILSKPTGLSLLPVLFLIDWYRGRINDKNVVLEKLPFFIYTLLIGWVSYYPNSSHSLVNVNDATTHVSETLLVWVWSFCFYIWKFLFPVHQYFFNELPQPISLLNWPYVLSVFLLIAILFSLFYWRKNRLLIFAFGFYFFSIVFLIPLNMSDHSMVSERYMYLSCLGLSFLMGASLEFLWNSKTYRMLLVILMLVMGFKTFNQCKVWHDSFTFTNEIIEKHPHQYPIAYVLRGTAFDEINQLAPAIQDFTTAISINQNYVKAYLDRGLAYVKIKDFKKATIDFDKVLELEPGNFIARFFNDYAKRKLK